MKKFIFAILIPLLVISCSATLTLPPQVEIFNRGIPGNNTRDLMARLYQDCLVEEPDLVVLLVGTNDFLNHKKFVPVPEYSINLNYLVQTIKKQSRVMIMTIPPCCEEYLLTRHPAEFYTQGSQVLIDECNRIINETAKKNSILCLDLNYYFKRIGEVGDNQASLIRNPKNSGADAKDGVHPTAAGYKLIAALIYEQIQKEKLKPGKIVCFGDSITYGSYMSGAGTAGGQTYPGYLKQLINKF